MGTYDLHDRLQKDERMIWSGAPAQGLLLTSRDWLLIPFSLMWGGFIVFWEFAAVAQTKGQTSFFALWGIPFILIGTYFILGRFFVDAWIRRGTFYALTNRRVLILRSGPFSNFISINLDRLPEASLSEGADGRGTIRFGPQVPVWGRRGFSSWTPALDPTPQFLSIENARAVFDEVQAAVRESH